LLQLGFSCCAPPALRGDYLLHLINLIFVGNTYIISAEYYALWGNKFYNTANLYC
jgi:hypothetical protein